MSCNERKDLLALLAAGALDDAEAAPLRAHVESGCPTCVGALAEAEAMLAHLPLALGTVEPSPGVRERLVQRVEADARARDTAADDEHATRTAVPFRTPAPAHRSTWWQPLAAAAVAASVTWFLVATPRVREQALLESQLASQRTRIDELEQAVAEAESLSQVLRSPEMLMVSIAGTENQTGAQGRILWDRDNNYWHFAVSGMQPAPAGKTYELWFVTAAEEKIPAGTFDVRPDGTAELLVAIPPGIGTIALAAVTDEPAGGSPQPTGAFQLLGQVPPLET